MSEFSFMAKSAGKLSGLSYMTASSRLKSIQAEDWQQQCYPHPPHKSNNLSEHKMQWLTQTRLTTCPSNSWEIMSLLGDPSRASDIPLTDSDRSAGSSLTSSWIVHRNSLHQHKQQQWNVWYHTNLQNSVTMVAIQGLKFLFFSPN